MINFYRHSNCPVQPGVEWYDKWDCACNDRCPACRAEIEPLESDGDAADPDVATVTAPPEIPTPTLFFGTPPGFPRVTGNALICSSGRTYQLRLLDRLYLRCGITTAEALERAYDAPEPQQGA